MIIESIDVFAFGKLTGYKTVFDGGFNLLHGSNESGKSTIAAFIAYMLYGFPQGDEKDELTERALRTPFSEEEAGGSMIFTAADVRYRVERHSLYGKNGWRDSYSLRNLETGETENEGISPGERFFGVGREVYLETAFFGIPRMGKADGKTVTDAIENIIFSGDEQQSVASAVSHLDEAADRLFSEKSEGALCALAREKEALEERLREAREKEKTLLEKEELLFVNRKKRDEAMAELQKFTSLETNYYNAIMIRDYNRLHELEDQSSARENAVKDYIAAHKTGEFLPDAEFLTDLAAAKGEYDSAKRIKDMARIAHDQKQNESSPITPEEKMLVLRVAENGGEEPLRREAGLLRGRIRRFLSWGGVFLAALLATLVLAIVCVTQEKMTVAVLLASASVVALGAVGVLLWECLRVRKTQRALFAICEATGHDEFLALLLRAADAGSTEKKWENERKQAADTAEVAEHTYELAKEKVNALLSRFGERLPNESLDDAVARLSKAAADYIYELGGLQQIKESAETEVRVLREKLADKNEIAVRARVAPADRERYCNQNVEDLRRGVEHFEEVLSKLLSVENTLVAELASFEVGESSASIAGKIATVEERIAEIKAKGEVYRAAAKAIRGGGARLRAEISPRLSFAAGNLLYEMTDGKYKEILVGDGMSVSFVAEDGPRDAAYLGDSTAELAYLSMKLALIELLYRKEMPPICFDGCTSLQDKERAEAFLRALRVLASEGKQCLCFTAHERERALADKVFTSYRYVDVEG